MFEEGGEWLNVYVETGDWKNMAMIALGQSKMIKRPIAGVLHIVVYVGFIIINLEVLEIIIDGLLGTHRIFYSVFSQSVYTFLINFFEYMALGVALSCILFLVRRNVISIYITTILS